MPFSIVWFKPFGKRQSPASNVSNANSRFIDCLYFDVTVHCNLRENQSWVSSAPKGLALGEPRYPRATRFSAIHFCSDFS
jgi:hypothetical protein